MSLQIWLPLNGDLHNQGLSDITITNNGATVNDNGKIGKCYYFNNNTIIFNSFSTTKSISFWIKTTKTNSTIAFVDYKSKLGFGFQSNGYIIPSCNGLSIKMYGSENFISNKWNHIVLIKKSSDIDLWINGVLQTTRLSTNYWSNSVDGCYLGGRSTGTNMICYLNDFRVYDHELSKQQIKKLSQGLILHYPLNRQGWGQDNLATCETSIQLLAAGITNNYYYFWVNNNTLEPNTTYTFSAICSSNNLDKCTIYNYTDSGKTGSIYHNFPVDGKRHSWTFTTTSTAIGLIAYVGNSGSTAGHSIMYENIKIEKGNKMTQWCPRITENLYSTMQIGNNVQYDISGYQNNGTKNNITYDSNTPKYDVSSVFTSANTSYIKVDDNKWMPQYQEAMTINLWAYSSNWSNTTKLFSCTESGGWNTEGGNSGYIRFPIYVATNSTQTSYAYKYSSQELKLSDLSTGWHMLTFIYDSTGNKVYVDGQLHSSYAFTSYGIRYNTNARLFLGCEANTASPYTPYFNGKLSDFRIYATVLSAEDVLSLYNNGAYIDQLNEIHGKVR